MTDQLLFKLEELAAAGTAMGHLKVNQSCAPEITPPKKKQSKNLHGIRQQHKQYRTGTVPIPSAKYSRKIQQLNVKKNICLDLDKS